MCQAIFDRLAPAVEGDSSDSVRKMTELYEINACRGHVAYIEAAFHDSPSGAKWIIEHKSEIAEAICQGVCDYYGVPYVAP